MKFKKILIPAFGILLVNLLSVQSYAFSGGWNLILEGLNKVINNPEVTKVLVSNTSQVKELELALSLPRSIINSLSTVFKSGYGEVSIDNIISGGLYQQFFNVAIISLFLIAVYEMIYILVNQGNHIEFIKNFIGSAINPMIYVIKIGCILLVLNAFIRVFKTSDMAGFLNGEINRLINYANTAQQIKWENRNLLNVFIDMNTEVANNFLKFNFFGNAIDLLDPSRQYTFFATVFTWIYLILGVFNWFIMWTAQVFINLCFVISPVIAISGMFEWGKQWQTNFWGLFIDAVVTLFSFHFIFYFLRTVFLSTRKADEVNLGYLALTAVVLLLLPILMLKFRSIFMISYQNAQENRSSLNQAINSSVSTTTNVINRSANATSSAITNASNMWK